MEKKMKRRNVTLIEMMIVMFLIATIVGVLAYNYQGTLDEAKKFKTEQSIEKIQTILEIELAKDPDLFNDIEQNWESILRKNPLIRNADEISKDGWGEKFEVRAEWEDGRQVIRVISRTYQKKKDS